jgi:hypothetical protein
MLPRSPNYLSILCQQQPSNLVTKILNPSDGGEALFFVFIFLGFFNEVSPGT